MEYNLGRRPHWIWEVDLDHTIGKSSPGNLTTWPGSPNWTATYMPGPRGQRRLEGGGGGNGEGRKTEGLVSYFCMGRLLAISIRQ